MKRAFVVAMVAAMSLVLSSPSPAAVVLSFDGAPMGAVPAGGWASQGFVLTQGGGDPAVFVDVGGRRALQDSNMDNANWTDVYIRRVDGQPFQLLSFTAGEFGPYYMQYYRFSFLGYDGQNFVANNTYTTASMNTYSEVVPNWFAGLNITTLQIRIHDYWTGYAIAGVTLTPEPATLSMVALAGLWLARRRR